MTWPLNKSQRNWLAPQEFHKKWAKASRIPCNFQYLSPNEFYCSSTRGCKYYTEQPIVKPCFFTTEVIHAARFGKISAQPHKLIMHTNFDYIHMNCLRENVWKCCMLNKCMGLCENLTKIQCTDSKLKVCAAAISSRIFAQTLHVSIWQQSWLTEILNKHAFRRRTA